ncbi:MAG: hypothetical protein GEU71_03635 [Actinobacteria bacterium]|nr:hypothetical protein [Actinomycetota bacterium]
MNDPEVVKGGVAFLVITTTIVLVFGYKGHEFLMMLGGIVMLIAWGAAIVEAASESWANRQRR